MHKHLPKFFVFLDHYNSDIFKNKNINIGIIYRNYKAKNNENQLMKIANACKKSRFKLFISNNPKLVYKVKADGIYIPAFNKEKSFLNLEKKNIIILGSAHNQKEIQNKISQKCKAIFLSPVFYVPKSKSFLNLYKFNYLAHSNKVKILALGGINEFSIRKLKLLSAKGFGGITLFKKKPALLRPVLIKNYFF